MVYTASSPQHKAAACIFILLFFMGLGIGLSSPVTMTYISTSYKGKQQSMLLSVLCGLFGIGGGIVPLAGAHAIYKGTTTPKANTDGITLDLTKVAHVSQIFYFVAAAFAILALTSALFFNYRCLQHKLSRKKDTKKRYKIKKKSVFYFALFLSMATIVSYLICETTSNFGLTQFIHVPDASGADPDSNKWILIQIFGLYAFIQGAWRIISGMFIVNRMRYKSFIYLSSFLIIASFVFIASGWLQYNYKLGYLIAVMLGIGIGNTWTIIFSYGITMDNQKAGLISSYINVIAMASILFTQLADGFIFQSLFTHGSYGINDQAGDFTRLGYFGLIGIFFAVGIIVLTFWLSRFLRKHKVKHVNDVKFDKKWNITRKKIR